LTRWLERQLLECGEELVRVPPKLMAPERRAGRARGKSDPIDALAVGRAALREPGLSRPRPGEQPFPAARTYLERKHAEGKSRREAIRCLKHQLARVVFNTLRTSPP
jgi:transposase